MRIPTTLPPVLIDDLPRAWEADKDTGPAKAPVFGAGLAAREFVHSLLAYGNAERLIIPISDERRRAAYEPLLSGLPNVERCFLLPLDRIRELYDREQLILLSLHSRLHDMLHLRSYASRPQWIATAITHAVSHRAGLTVGLYVLLGETRPFDILACTSTAGRIAVEKLLEHLLGCLSPKCGSLSMPEFRTPVIPLGVDEEIYAPGDRSEARRALNLDSERVTFLCLGRFSLETKMDLFPLLLAFRDAFAEYPNKPVLIIAGDDTEYKLAPAIRAYAEQLGLSNDVAIRADVTRAEKLRLYQAADAFVSLSDNLQETFGCTVLEALSCGLPVIASDWNGYRDLVHDGQNGFLVPTVWGDCWSSHEPAAPFGGDREYRGRLAETVAFDMPIAVSRFRELERSADLRRSMGRCARQCVLESFTWSKVIRQHERLWMESLAMAKSYEPRAQLSGLSAYDPLQVFNHYPTRLLAGSDRVTATASGLRFLAGDTELHPAALGTLAPDRNALLSVLATVANSDECAVSSVREVPCDLALQCLLHLLKYGFIRFTGPG